MVPEPSARSSSPENLQETALRAHHKHTTACHRDVNKTLGALRDRYCWPGLTSHFKKWVRACHKCGAKNNWGKRKRSSMWSLTPRGNKFVLVVTDYFTKKAESNFIPNKEASTVAEKLYD